MLQSSVLAALEAGRAYVNIHTPRNPAGRSAVRSGRIHSASPELKLALAAR
jgi:hypothetical protein